MASSKIPFNGSGYKDVAHSYGIHAYHASFGLLNIIFVTGTAAGTIGTSGHTFDLPSSVPNCPQYLQVNGSTEQQRYMVSLQGRTIIIMPREGEMKNNPYINVSLIYSSI